jgi:hypothetical protein
LNTTLFPQASAGKIFQVGIAIGKLNGVMIPHTPMGRRKVIAHLSGSSEGTVKPNARRHSAAA